MDLNDKSHPSKTKWEKNALILATHKQPKKYNLPPALYFICNRSGRIGRKAIGRESLQNVTQADDIICGRNFTPVVQSCAYRTIKPILMSRNWKA